MENEVLYEDKNLRLTYVSKGNYIYETWVGDIIPEVFSQLQLLIIELLSQKQATGILFDGRDLIISDLLLSNVADQKMRMYANKIGKFRLAIIHPKDSLSKLSIESYLSSLDSESIIITRYFQTSKDAENWMKLE